MSESSITIYHNPHCSKSRQALSLLQENGIDPTIVEYLKQPLAANEIIELINLLKSDSDQIIRKQDALFKELNIENEKMDDDSLLQLLLDYPALMQRPIIANSKHAMIARPPELVLNFIKTHSND